jgi:SET domain-containing protein 6
MYVHKARDDICQTDRPLEAHVNHGDSLEVIALRSELLAGTEILNYYGPLPSSELLRRYGYVTPEHRRYDLVELSWSLVRSALGDQLNLAEDVLDQVVSHEFISHACRAKLTLL